MENHFKTSINIKLYDKPLVAHSNRIGDNLILVNRLPLDIILSPIIPNRPNPKIHTLLCNGSLDLSSASRRKASVNIIEPISYEGCDFNDVGGGGISTEYYFV